MFDAPWHAETLALAFALSEAGAFTASAWSEALGAALRDAERRGAPDDQETYYQAALAALETLLDDAGEVSTGTLAARTEQWRRAYLNTPHGKPVLLSAGDAESG